MSKSKPKAKRQGSRRKATQDRDSYGMLARKRNPKIWIKRDGTKIPLREMTADHIINAIRYFSNPFNEVASDEHRYFALWQLLGEAKRRMKILLDRERKR